MLIPISRKKEKATIEIIGNNSESVTGSCSKITYEGHTFLFELGMIQDGHTILENYKLNKKLISKIKPKEIEYVVIGHAHCDHIGNIPALYQNGNCNATIIVPKGSISILKEMWLDSAYINKRDCEVLSLKSSTPYIPLYGEDEVMTALSHVIEYDCDTIYNITDYLAIRYSYAGHILCSCQTEVYINGGSNTRKIVFTSDLGNVLTENERVFVQKLKPITKSNIVIGECTYAKRERTMNKKDIATDLAKIKTVVEQFCVENKHRVLIPTFSLDRMPFIIWQLYKLFGQDSNFTIPIYVDSPLSNRLLDCYSSILEGEAKEKFDEMMSWSNIKRIITPEDSKYAVEDKGAKVVLASSGMLTAGRSIKWTQNILSKENDCILFIGYAGEDTLAYKIKNGSSQKTISINGKPIRNRCQIVDLKSFSSHMQRNDLINYYKSFNCEKIYLVHSNNNDKLEFKEDLEAAISDCLKSTRVIAVNRSTKISL